MLCVGLGVEGRYLVEPVTLIQSARLHQIVPGVEFKAGDLTFSGHCLEFGEKSEYQYLDAALVARRTSSSPARRGLAAGVGLHTPQGVFPLRARRSTPVGATRSSLGMFQHRGFYFFCPARPTLVAANKLVKVSPEDASSIGIGGRHGPHRDWPRLFHLSLPRVGPSNSR